MAELTTLWLCLRTCLEMVAGGMALIAVHEGGHILAGCLVGFRCEFFQIGPLLFSRPDGRWRIGLAERFWQVGLTGCRPQDRFGTRAQWAAVHLGGSAASLLFSLVTFAVVLTQPLRVQQSLSGVGVLGILSALAGVLNLIPMRFGGLSSDGLHLWQYALNGWEYRWRRAQWEQHRATKRPASAAPTPAYHVRTGDSEDWMPAPEFFRDLSRPLRTDAPAP